MSDFITRLREEKAQLDERVEKLGVFVTTQTFLSLTPEHQTLLAIQLGAMTTYGLVLDRRIALLE